MMRGLADLLVVKDVAPSFLSEERIGKLSEDQADCARLAITVGAEYHLVQSAEDVQRCGS